MATYILFWNPDNSWYSMEDYQYGFESTDDMNEWDFTEYEDVNVGDTFYMIKCGKGRKGIVAYGAILSECCVDGDLSSKMNKTIYTADICTQIVINPLTAPILLTPEKLTGAIPDFDWYGGPSGRLLSSKDAEILNKLFVNYIDENPELFQRDSIICYGGSKHMINSRVATTMLSEKYGNKCEVCGKENAESDTNLLKDVRFRYIGLEPLPRSLYCLCDNCFDLDVDVLRDKLKTLKA